MSVIIEKKDSRQTLQDACVTEIVNICDLR